MRLIKEYCCCAIPLLNAGIYITLTEQFVVAVTAGILTLVTPPRMFHYFLFGESTIEPFASVVGTSFPSFVPTVFAVLCFVAAAAQVFGFMGVFKVCLGHKLRALSFTFLVQESTIIFRRYTTLHLFTLTAVFSFAAVFIGISASKHSTAAANCITNFFPVDARYVSISFIALHLYLRPDSTTATALTGSDSEGKLLCDIFTWVGVGTLGGLWLVLAIFHVSHLRPIRFHFVLSC